MTTMTAALRKAIESNKGTRTALALAAGIDRVQLHRFLKQERTLTLETVDAITTALGVDVRLVKPRKARLPALPKPDADGNYPAVEYARASLARKLIRARASSESKRVRARKGR